MTTRPTYELSRSQLDALRGVIAKHQPRWSTQDAKGWTDYGMAVDARDGESLSVTVTSWERNFGLTFDFLRALSLFFGTRDVSVEHGQREDGCDTCGSGAVFEITIYVAGITKNGPAAQNDP